MDYKELIENIKKVVNGLREDDAPKCATVCECAAVALETLLAERDAALRTQQTPAKLDRSRWNRCKDCKRQWGVLDDITSRFEIRREKFCGTCGRPLTEEAWAELERKIGGNDGTADKKD